MIDVTRYGQIISGFDEYLGRSFFVQVTLVTVVEFVT